mmetsp:Transcript_14710/g.40439  ORF Transcript_14710/g.40439 Transcript_14710/m.40439 type:complete len:209 (-) Transcript_14710:1257-1883(-)
MSGLAEGIGLLLRIRYGSKDLRHQGCHLSFRGFLLEAGKFVCSDVEAHCHLLQLFLCRHGHLLGVPLGICTLLKQESPRLCDGRVRLRCSSLELSDGLRGFFGWQHLDSFEERQLGLLAFQQRFLRSVHLLVREAEHLLCGEALPLFFQGTHHLLEFRTRHRGPLFHFDKFFLHCWRSPDSAVDKFRHAQHKLRRWPQQFLSRGDLSV